MELRWERVNDQFVGFSADVIVAWLAESQNGSWSWHVNFANETGVASRSREAQAAAEQSWRNYCGQERSKSPDDVLTSNGN